MAIVDRPGLEKVRLFGCYSDFDPQAGVIQLDNHALQDWDLERLRQSIGLFRGRFICSMVPFGKIFYMVDRMPQKMR